VEGQAPEQAVEEGQVREQAVAEEAG